ncbi:MAG: cytochrome c oxidase, cbb3-type, subunit [Polaromonas sp.]|jgi:cytochrome c oxidase cbb3-type subunit 3|nr:cytochrome c oxidase, cbb3-type, subunit [Polaromonas sp.]
MSDFTSGFWPWYVAGISIVSILACAWLLWVAGKAVVKTVPGAVSDNTTGHVWDEDLRELNNPLPRWWMWLFIITVVVSLAYLVVYPGLGSFKGLMNWSTEGEHRGDVAQLSADVAPLYAAFSKLPVDVLAKDARAVSVGERVFMNNCAQCHGSDARGSKSYPNLTGPNVAWLGHRNAEHIVDTVTNGRTGVMPAMAVAVGGEAELSELANYVLSLSGSPHNQIKAFTGKSRFAACAACHGVDGKGNKALGAPNLTDDYWLHGWGEAAVISIIKSGKINVMPAQSAILTPDQIRVVSAYVYSLSGSNAVAPVAAAANVAPAGALTVSASSADTSQPAAPAAAARRAVVTPAAAPKTR